MTRPALLDFDTALAELLTLAAPLGGSERAPTADALDRVLASDVRSTLDVPPMDNAQMDGWAVRCADLVDGRPLPVSQRVPAGAVPAPLAAGTVARIFTGATIPAGADAVVMQEQAEAAGEGVRFAAVPSPGEWIRRAGEDVRRDSVVLRAGTRLSPQALGLAASVGLAELPVRPRLRVACFFTGDELTLPGEPLAPGAIYNSNRFVLVALLRRLGCAIHDLGIVPDSLEATRTALRRAADDSDLAIPHAPLGAEGHGLSHDHDPRPLHHAAAPTQPAGRDVLRSGRRPRRGS